MEKWEWNGLNMNIKGCYKTIHCGIYFRFHCLDIVHSFIHAVLFFNLWFRNNRTLIESRLLRIENTMFNQKKNQFSISNINPEYKKNFEQSTKVPCKKAWGFPTIHNSLKFFCSFLSASFQQSIMALKYISCALCIIV